MNRFSCKLFIAMGVSFYSAAFIYAQQSPYHGTPLAIPGKIQVEDFDRGGEGVAYHDTTTSNSGGSYRTSEGVDIEPCLDIGAGYDIGWTEAGEWMEYTVNVSAGGSYTIEFRFATNWFTPGTLHIEFDGVDKTGAINIPNTGSNQAWATVTRQGVVLSSGVHVMRIALDSSNGNINYVNFIFAGINNTPSAPDNLECESQVNPQGITNFDPNLSWKFNDPDSWDSQSAYQILVANSAADISGNDGKMWNTGKITSAINNVTYNGQALQQGATYYWKVMLWDQADSAGPYSSVASFSCAAGVITPPATAQYTYSNPYGVNNWWWPSNYCGDFVNAHMNCWRIMIDWNGHESTNNSYYFSEYDQAIDNAYTYGAKLSLCIYNSPSWSRTSSGKILSCSPSEHAQFTVEAIKYCENRHAGVVAAVEIQNEDPTGVSASAGVDQRDASWYYANILKASYQAVHDYNQLSGKNVLVVMDGIWNGAYNHLDDLYQMGCRNYFDRINFHYYLLEQRTSDTGKNPDPSNTGQIWHFPTNLKYMKYIAQENNDASRLVWFTEFGWRYADDNHETEQANYTQYCLDICRKSGFVDMASIYLGTDPNDRMATIDESPYREKPVYNVFLNMGNQHPEWTEADMEPVTPLTPASSNIILTNPDFESGNSSGWNGLTVDAAVKHSGNYSGKVSAPDYCYTDYYSCDPGRLYEVTAWLKIDAANSTACDMTLFYNQAYDGAGETQSTPTNYVGLVDTRNYPSGWRRIRYMILTRTDKNQLRVMFASSGAGTFWVDDLQIKSLDLSGNFNYSPQINVTPAALSFTEVPLNKTKSMQLNIANSGVGTLSGTITCPDKWITIEPLAFNGNNIQVSVTADNRTLQQKQGSHASSIIIQSNGGTITIPINLTATCVLVKPNPVRLSSPLVGEGGGEGCITFFGDGIVQGQTTIKIYTLSGELVDVIAAPDLSSVVSTKREPESSSLSLRGASATWQSEEIAWQPPTLSPGIYLYVYDSPKEKGVNKFTVIR